MSRQSISALLLPRVWAPALLLQLATTAAAQWSTDPAINQVVSAAASDQNQPKVAATSDGGYWVSWFDGIGTGWDVRLQRFDVDGVAVFPQGGILVADRGFSSTQDYGLDVTDVGDALLAFRDDRSGTIEITAARYAPDGTPAFGPSGVTLTSGAGFVASPRITRGRNVSFVAWTENSSVRIRTVGPDGTPGSVDRTWTPVAGSYALADMHTSGEDAIFSVVHQTGGFGSPRHLFAQRFTPSGLRPWGTALTPVFDSGSLQFGAFPKFTVDGAGESLLVWYSSSPSLQCFAQRLTNAGGERWQQGGVEVATTPGMVRVDPVGVTMHPVGDSVIAWREQNAGQSQSGISLQRIAAASGQRLWTDSGVSLVPVGASGASSPGLHVDASSTEFVVTWEESPAFGSDRIFGARVDAAGAAAIPTFDIASTASGKSRVTGAAGRFGGVLTAWSDSRSDGGDILMQQVFSDGTPGEVGIISMPACVGVPNSAGLPSRTFAVGRTLAQANNVTLWNVDMPNHAFGFFLTSQTPDFVVAPGSSVGNLCLGGAIGRFVGAGQLSSSGVNGSISVPLDLALHPTPTGLVTVASGESWYYQAWHRDQSMGVPVSNFSEACSVTYQ